MEGITIVSEYVVRGNSIPLIIVSIIFFYGLCIVETILSRYLFKQSTTKGPKFLAILIPTACWLICSYMIFDSIGEYNTWYNRYIITIDDTVGYNEFVDTYDIISVEGDQYTVKLKGEE